jgi:hypothetical protein
MRLLCLWHTNTGGNVTDVTTLVHNSWQHTELMSRVPHLGAFWHHGHGGNRPHKQDTTVLLKQQTQPQLLLCFSQVVQQCRSGSPVSTRRRLCFGSQGPRGQCVSSLVTHMAAALQPEPGPANTPHTSSAAAFTNLTSGQLTLRHARPTGDLTEHMWQPGGNPATWQHPATVYRRLILTARTTSNLNLPLQAAETASKHPHLHAQQSKLHTPQHVLL